jgi:hypothetical protein
MGVLRLRGNIAVKAKLIAVTVSDNTVFSHAAFTELNGDETRK